MLQLNSVMAWVTVDGIALDHYNVEVSAEKKELTCWIPSQEGKVSAFKFARDPITFPTDSTGIRCAFQRPQVRIVYIGRLCVIGRKYLTGKNRLWPARGHLRRFDFKHFCETIHILSS